MAHRDEDPLYKALQVFTAAIDLPRDTTERILQHLEGARYKRDRELYAAKRATGWRRTYTKAQLKVRAAAARKKRAAKRAAQRAQLQQLKRAA